MLVHGIGVSGRYLLPTARRLCSARRVLVPDLPGFGRSPRPPRRLSLADLADVLAKWFDVLGVGRVPLLGNSFGCQILVELAIRHPERVTALVLAGPTIDPQARSPVRQLLRLAADSAGEPPGLWALILVDYTLFVVKGGLPLVSTMLNDPIEEKLPRVEAPTLVVRGGRDRIVPQRWAEEVATALPRGELKVVPRAPHAVNYAAPDDLAALVDDFLERQHSSWAVGPHRRWRQLPR